MRYQKATTWAASPSGAVDTLGTAWLMTGATMMLGIGLILVDPDAATIVVLGSFIVSIAAMAVARRPRLTVSPSAVRRILAFGIVAQGFIMATLPVLPERGYQIALVLLSLVAANATLAEHRWRTAQAGIVIAGHFAAMCWMLAATEVPPIDVIPFQQEGAAALLAGTNPYALRYDNIFGPDTPYYAPELIVGDKLDFGFLYPPLSLLMAVPGYVIAGDYRYGAVAAVSITAALVAFARGGRISTGAGMLILTAPATQHVLYWGWTEPFLVVLIAWTIFLAIRNSRATPWALGLAMAAKQFGPALWLVGILMLMRVRRRVGLRTMVLVPVAVGIATVIPFVLWDAGEFLHSVLTVQLLQPFRLDAITIPALLARFEVPPTPSILGFLLGAITLLILVRFGPRTVAGFCYSVALFFLVFFVLNKHAFVNYYFFVMVVMACGVATTHTSTEDARAR